MRRAAVTVLAALCAACAAPRVEVREPTSARPAAAPAEAAREPGAIYRAGSYRPLFEDRRARYVGDTLTIVIAERVSATQKNATVVARGAEVKAEIPTFNVPLVNNVPVVKGYHNRMAGTAIEGSSSNRLDAKGETSASNVFSGTITVTVVEVLANGNLVVAGEKQLGTNREKEVLRFSGVVNPATIVGNTVSSTQVADARLEYRGEGALDSAQVMGWLARFFLSVLPF